MQNDQIDKKSNKLGVSLPSDMYGLFMFCDDEMEKAFRNGFGNGGSTVTLVWYDLRLVYIDSRMDATTVCKGEGRATIIRKVTRIMDHFHTIKIFAIVFNNHKNANDFEYYENVNKRIRCNYPHIKCKLVTNPIELLKVLGCSYPDKTNITKALMVFKSETQYIPFFGKKAHIITHDEINSTYVEIESQLYWKKLARERKAKQKAKEEEKNCTCITRDEINSIYAEIGSEISVVSPPETTIEMSPYAGTSFINFDLPEAFAAREKFLGWPCREPFQGPHQSPPEQQEEEEEEELFARQLMKVPPYQPPPQQQQEPEMEVEEKEEATCVICFDNKRNCAFVPCGHVACCITCAKKLKELCPMCMQKFDSILKLYKC